MANVDKINIASLPGMVGILDSAVASGEYTSASEVIGEALRDWKLKCKVEALQLDELRCLVQEGINSSPSIDAELVFSSLRVLSASVRKSKKVVGLSRVRWQNG